MQGYLHKDQLPEKQQKNISANTEQKQEQKKTFMVSDQFLNGLYFEIGPLTQERLFEAKQIKKQVKRQKFCYLLKKYLLKDNNIEVFSKIAYEIIERILNYKISGYFISSITDAINQIKNINQKLFNQQKLSSLLNQIHHNEIPYFAKAFGVQIPKQMFLPLVEQLTSNKLFHQCSTLIKQNGSNLNYVNALIQALLKESYDAKQAGKIIKQHGYGAKQFPQIDFELHKNAVKYFCYSQGWQFFQQIFCYKTELFVFGINELFKKHHINEVLSICQRNPQIQGILLEKNIKKIKENKGKFKFVNNPLQTNKFQPQNQNCLHLTKDFNIKRQQIIMIDDQSQNLSFIMKKINASGCIGIDTQSILIRNTFTKDLDVLAVIQVAIRDQIFLFDSFRLNSKQIKDGFQQFLSNKNNILIVHDKGGDQNLLLKVLKINNNIMCCQIISITSLFRDAYNLKKQSGTGLAKICEKVFKKPLCKKYTMTNWGRRPLLHNQVHYAALDAFVLIILWQNLSKEIHLKSKQKQQNLNNQQQQSTISQQLMPEIKAEQQIIKQKQIGLQQPKRQQIIKQKQIQQQDLKRQQLKNDEKQEMKREKKKRNSNRRQKSKKGYRVKEEQNERSRSNKRQKIKYKEKIEQSQGNNQTVQKKKVKYIEKIVNEK